MNEAEREDRALDALMAMATRLTDEEVEKVGSLMDEKARAALAARAPEVLARCEAATRGPWAEGYEDGSGMLEDGRGGACIVARGHEDDLGLGMVVVAGGNPEGDCAYGVLKPADIAFAAHARTDLPAMTRAFLAEREARRKAETEHEQRQAELVDAEQQANNGWDRVEQLKAERDRLRKLADGLAAAIDRVLAQEPNATRMLSAYRDATKEAL